MASLTHDVFAAQQGPPPSRDSLASMLANPLLQGPPKRRTHRKDSTLESLQERLEDTLSLKNH